LQLSSGGAGRGIVSASHQILIWSGAAMNWSWRTFGQHAPIWLAVSGWHAPLRNLGACGNAPRNERKPWLAFDNFNPISDARTRSDAPMS